MGRRPDPYVQDNESVRVTSSHDGPVTYGDFRGRGRFDHQHVQARTDKYRHTQNQTRTEPGLIRTWDESRNDAR